MKLCAFVSNEAPFSKKKKKILQFNWRESDKEYKLPWISFELCLLFHCILNHIQLINILNHQQSPRCIYMRKFMQQQC